MSAKEDDQLCDLFERLMHLRRKKIDFLSLDSPQTLEDEDPEDEENNLLTSLPEIISGMYSADLNRILMATTSLRRMLAKGSYYLIQEIIEAGLVTLLVTFLSCDDQPLLQCDAAWSLTIIASETSQQTCAVVQAGAVPQLIRLLASPHVRINYYCVWALGNIIGDGAELRDFVIQNGILSPLMRLVDMNAPIKFLRTLTWVILNLCRNDYPPPKLEAINACLSALRILITHTDYEILSDACMALRFVALDETRNLIQLVVESPGVLSRLVELLSIPESSVIIPALKAIGNIACGNDSQTQALIDCKVLQMLPPLLQHPDVNIKELACWVLSNITNSSSEQIQAVIDCNLLPLVVEVLNTGDFKSQREATMVIIDITTKGTLEHINYVVQCGTLKILCDLLTTKENKLLNVYLRCIFRVLEATNKFGQVEHLYVLLKEIGALDKIEKLRHNADIGVMCMSFNIIHKLF